jgi:hypothetical protein
MNTTEVRRAVTDVRLFLHKATRVKNPRDRAELLTDASEALRCALEDPDFRIRDEGTVALLIPQNEEAEGWVEEFVQVEDWQRYGGAIAVEPRCVPGLVDGIVGTGLTVRFQ